MSNYLTGLALRCRLANPYRKVLLIMLTDRADDQTGLTPPASISYLAHGCECSVTTIKKYRRELGRRRESDKEEATRFDLITWKSSKGYGGAAVYKIDVARLKALAAEWTPGAYSPASNGREATISPEVIGATRPTNGRDAPRNLTNKRATNERDAPDLFSSVRGNYLSTPEAQQYAPSFEDHPAVKRYLDAFRMSPAELEQHHREEIVGNVELSASSLQAWRLTLEDFRSVVGWSHKHLKNVFDRYWRYKRNDIKPNEARPGLPGDFRSSKDKPGGERKSKKTISPGFQRKTRTLEDFRRAGGYDD